MRRISQRASPGHQALSWPRVFSFRDGTGLRETQRLTGEVCRALKNMIVCESQVSRSSAEVDLLTRLHGLHRLPDVIDLPVGHWATGCPAEEVMTLRFKLVADFLVNLHKGLISWFRDEEPWEVKGERHCRLQFVFGNRYVTLCSP